LKRNEENMKRICGWSVTTVAIALGLMAAIAGCKSSDVAKQNNEGSTTQATPSSAVPLDPATLGTVNGSIRLDGKPPERVKIDMSMDPVCSIMGGDNFAEQYIAKDGKLANVYVYVKSGPPAAMAVPTPKAVTVVMDQVGCKYIPHVVALMRGGSVEFRNSDGTMHNIHTMPSEGGTQPIDISQGPKGTPQVKQFNQPEVMLPVRCNNHPWMNAFINVSATPFFAMTGPDGHFSISGLPPGTYTLAAAHEKAGEQTMTVTIEPKGTTKADFSFNVK
jgi:plastocyanin